MQRDPAKSLESVSKNYGAELKDTKSVTITLEPAAERGIRMLSYAYDEAGRDNETWLYLSTLGRVKRIAAGDTDEETEPASLFGSEFTTEDTDTGKLEEYSFNILEETTISGREVWKLEMIPNEERARKLAIQGKFIISIKSGLLPYARRCTTDMIKKLSD